jgi:hypothetical protein
MFIQKSRRDGDLLFVFGRSNGLAAALRSSLEDEVVHEANPVAFGNGAHLVFAVGVERGEAQLRALGAAHVQSDFAVAVANDEFASAMRGRQHHDQGAEHTFGLLGVRASLLRHGD